MDEAKGLELTAERLTTRVFGFNFAAIQVSTIINPLMCLELFDVYCRHPPMYVRASGSLITV